MEIASSRSVPGIWPLSQGTIPCTRTRRDFSRRTDLPAEPATKTIFLVHNSSCADTTVKGAIQERGYKVVHARSVGEALQVWSKTAVPIDLFLADISLGRDPGVERLVQILQADNPRMRVLYANDLEQTTGPLTMGQSYAKQLVEVVDNCLA